MVLLAWIAGHSLPLIEICGIVGSLLFTAASIRASTRAQRMDTLLRITERHIEIWQQTFDNRSLKRIKSLNPDLKNHPVSAEEHRFISSLILNLYSTYRAIENGLMDRPEGQGDDIRQFFSRPIPFKVWKSIRPLLDHDFTEFVEGHLNEIEEP
jgi:hypothetical protein